MPFTLKDPEDFETIGKSKVSSTPSKQRLDTSVIYSQCGKESNTPFVSFASVAGLVIVQPNYLVKC